MYGDCVLDLILKSRPVFGLHLDEAEKADCAAYCVLAFTCPCLHII